MINLKISKKEGMSLRDYARNMLENSLKFVFINYWRSIDKKILLCFFILFFLGLFFSFSSTSSLAGERLNKEFYFFFTKHLIFTFLAVFIMIVISTLKIELIMKFVIPLFHHQAADWKRLGNRGNLSIKVQFLLCYRF